MADQPKTCCRIHPEIFTDTRTGRTERMWVVACPDCGRFTDDPRRADAIRRWNQGHKHRHK